MKSSKDLSILVINCGSSSLKFRIIRMPEETEVISGEAVRVGTQTKLPSAINYTVAGANKSVQVSMPDHSSAFREAVKLINEEAVKNPKVSFDAIAHRYVHPGKYFNKTVKLDKKSIAALNKTLCLAPIHNTISLKLIKTCDREFSKIPQYAVFDTAFHKNIPKELYSYALPYKLVEKYHLKKAGFHGISHRYVMEEASRFIGSEPAQQKIISCHLGSGGSSICAIKNGKSINNSMGFTPLEGLMMNTRSGDIDIGILLEMMLSSEISPEEADKILNFKSGILGVFNESSDLREVIKNAQANPKAQSVFEMYVRRARKYISFYSILLKKADILIFTDTLGTEMPVLRSSICEGLECFGIKLEKDKNNSKMLKNTDITAADSSVKVLVIPTNEEIMIAREAYSDYCS